MKRIHFPHTVDLIQLKVVGILAMSKYKQPAHKFQLQCINGKIQQGRILPFSLLLPYKPSKVVTTSRVPLQKLARSRQILDYLHLQVESSKSSGIRSVL